MRLVYSKTSLSVEEKIFKQDFRFGIVFSFSNWELHTQVFMQSFPQTKWIIRPILELSNQHISMCISITIYQQIMQIEYHEVQMC